MDIERAVDEWRSLLGAQLVLTETEAQTAYGIDTGGAIRVIPAALRITDPAQLPQVMRIAKRCGVALYPISTGRNWGYGTALPALDGSTIVDLSQLRRILHFDAELGVVTVEPGVTQQMLAQFLDAGGHPYMVPTTGAGPSCSLLGNAVERGYGITPHADHFSAVTDLEAVLADGSIYRTALRELGGEDLARLFKWGVGPYTAGLFTQSGLGIVTRVSILLVRRPECVKVGLFGLTDSAPFDPVVEGVRRILSTLPGAVGGINLMNRHRVLAMSSPFPFDRLNKEGLISSTAIQEMGHQHQVKAWTGFITLYGTHRMISTVQKEIRRILRGTVSGLMFFSHDSLRRISTVAGWLPGQRLRQASSKLSTLAQALDLVEGRPNETALALAYWGRRGPFPENERNPSRDRCGLLWYAPLVPMRPSAVRALESMVIRVTKRYGIEPLVTFTSVSDRIFDATVPLLFDRDDPRQVTNAQNCLSALVHAGRELGCFPYRLNVDQQRILAATSGQRLAAVLATSGPAVAGRYASSAPAPSFFDSAKGGTS